MTTFKWLVRLKIVTNLGLAIYMLLHPVVFAQLLRFEDVPDPAWIQAFAIAVIFLTMGYVPSAIAPLKTRAANLYILIAPIVPIILLFWLAWPADNFGFRWVAIYEFASALLLGITFQRGWIADLMTKP